MAVSESKEEDAFEQEIRVFDKYKETVKDKNLTKKDIFDEFVGLGKNYESLLKQSKKLLKIGDSTQRRLFKTQNDLQETNSQLEASFNNLKILSQIGQTITSSLDTKQIIESVYKYISTLMDVGIIAIGVFEAEKNVIKYKFCIKTGQYIPSLIIESLDEDNLSAICINSKKELIIRDVEEEYLSYSPELQSQWGEHAVSLAYFPLFVEDRLIGILTIQSKKKDSYSENDLNILRTLASYVGIAIDNADAYKSISKKNKQLKETLDKINLLNHNLALEKEKSEKLLLNILPSDVAEELKATGIVQPVHFESASVLFTDFKGFTLLAEKMTPEALIHELDQCFSAFDNIMIEHNIEKLKTIGDSYMCAGGIPIENKTHAFDMVLAALKIISFMENVKKQKKDKNEPYFDLRLGIHTGPIVAGVVGSRKFCYDIWGDSVNTASRMESSGSPGKINISSTTFAIVKDFFESESRGKIAAKNKGEIEMYFIHRIRPDFSADTAGILPNEKFLSYLKSL